MKKVHSKEQEQETVEAPQMEMPQPPKEIAIKVDALNGFGQILEVILAGDDRLKPCINHYSAMIKAAVEENEKIK